MQINKEWFEIYVFNTILREDNYLLLINIVIPLLCFIFNYSLILFPLQLFTSVKVNDTINHIIKAFTYKLDELLSMVLFLFILIFFYANLGFFFLAQEFDVNLNDGRKVNTCHSLIDCVITYFNFGIRSGGGIGDIMQSQPFYDTYNFTIRFCCDMIFYFTVILLIMNMINGIIISTFGALRELNQKLKEDKDTKCFICSLSKSHFEKYKINFEDHKRIEHHIYNYVKYFIILKVKDIRDLNSEEAYINSCLMNKDIGLFPVYRSKALQSIPDYKFDGEVNYEDN